MDLEKKTGRILYTAVYMLSSDWGERAWCLLPELGTVGLRPAGLLEGARWPQRRSNSSSTGWWWSVSALPAASLATGCLIFANYSFFSEQQWFYFYCGHSQWLLHVNALHAGPQGSWEGPSLDAGLVASSSWGTAERPGKVLVGTGMLGTQVPQHTTFDPEGTVLCNLPLWLSRHLTVGEARTQNML